MGSVMMYAICTNATLMMVIAVSVLMLKEIRVIEVNLTIIVVMTSACLIIVIWTMIHVESIYVIQNKLVLKLCWIIMFETKHVVSLRNVTSMDKTVHVLLIVIITCGRIMSVKKSAIIKNVLGIAISVAVPLSKVQPTYMWREILSKMIRTEMELWLTHTEV